MIRSMTGYGTSEGPLSEGEILRVEIRTVNHRHLNPNIRLPHGWDALEKPITDALRKRLGRGHVSVALTLERADTPSANHPQFDLDRADHYTRSLQAAQEQLGLTGAVDINTLARFSDLFRSEKAPAALPEASHVVARVDEALEQVVELRSLEGGRLETELRRCLTVMIGELDDIERRAPERLLKERDRLREQIRALAESVDVDEDRLAREVAYLAEKWDIQEEIVRFRSHVALFEETLAPSRVEKAGKRLGFVVQEMNREANTIGSKANDPEIAAAAVAIKEQLEQLREQLENVE